MRLSTSIYLFKLKSRRIMKRLINTYLLLILIWLPFAACDIEESESDPALSFTRIYDDNRFEASYQPIDISQTPDDGYLILASRQTENSSFPSAYLMKLDAEGNFVQENDFGNELSHPLDNFLEIGGKLYFVAMNGTDLRALLVPVNEDGTTAEPVQLGGLMYPLHAAADNGNIILQSYDHEDKRTVVSVVSTGGTISKQSSFDIGPGSETEAPIIGHFTQSGKKLPFRVGKTPSGLYYFNGFYNYTFSLVFTDLADDGVVGVTQGQHENGGISEVMPMNQGYFAVSSFNFGINYLMPRIKLEMTGITSTVDLVGNPFPELVPDAPVEIRRLSINSSPVITFGSFTRNGQIVLHAFDETSGILLGSEYLGYGDQNTLSSFIGTSDGGIAVLGTTFVAGRFGRIVLYKLSTEQASQFSE